MAQVKSPQKKANVRTPCPAYALMLGRWKLINTILGGTEAMRAETGLLPQYPEESNAVYNSRKDRATLVNRFESTLENLVGRPFSEPVILGEDVPPAIVELAENVDRRRTNLQAFLRSWFRESWAKGFSHVLIEFPTPKEVVGDNGQPRARTLDDDRRENLTPFWNHISPENVLAMYSAVAEDGTEQLTHVRILETTVERVGWEEVVIERVRVLEPGVWQLYKAKDPAKPEGEWLLESEGVTTVGFIPMVTFFTGIREGAMLCKPPLLDLAYLNVAHWQSSSDQRNVLTVARFPILAGAGVSPDDPVKIGPNKYLTTEAADGKWYYVEHTGAAIEAGAKDLLDLEDKMSEYGAEFLKKKPGNQTATARALDSAEGSSYLGSTVLDFQDAVELALLYTAKWLRLEEGGSIKLSTTTSIEDESTGTQDSLIKMRANRDISRIALLKEMKDRGVLGEDFDVEKNAQELKDEGDEGMGDMFDKGNGTQTNPVVPADPIVPENEA